MTVIYAINHSIFYMFFLKYCKLFFFILLSEKDKNSYNVPII